MKRWWLIPTLIGVVAFAALANWGYNATKDRQTLVTQVNNRNQRAFFELVDNVQNMEIMLSKGIVSGSAKQRMLIFADIWQQAYAAQENLSQVPMNNTNMIRTSRFLTQTGDYAWTLAKKYARGDEVSGNEISKLNQLHAEAGVLATELNKITRTASDGLLTWGEIRRDTRRQLAGQQLTVPDGLGKIDKTMEEFPTLIYDGPFSDHITQRKPAGLTGGNIDAAQARRTAEKLVESGSPVNFKVVRTENINGTIPAFRIYLTPENANTPRVLVDISKKGGHAVSMINSRDVRQAKLSAESTLDIAAKFMAGLKQDMVPTYMVEQGNSGTVIFESKKDNVIIYPDLIKVKVAMDNGEIIGFDSTQYLMNHRDRSLPKPKLTEKEARAKVNSQLKVAPGRLTLIPLENLREVLAYEFRGTVNGDTFIVYINALTGDEEQILKVIETNGGPVTM